ncbi:MAG TPA: dihydrodipicolinate synthase family protein [Armatimonadota bacterium]|jgi:N-acetylneuraminate lyase
MQTHIEGLIAAPFTPMDAEGQLNIDVVESYAALLQRNGVAGAFIGGTTGESLSLTLCERQALTAAWMAAAPAALKVIVHVGHTCLDYSVTLAAQAQQVGACAIAAMAPCFFKPGLHELVAYCRQIAAAAPELPFYYYHIPSMTGVHIPMADFLQAAGPLIPNLAGVKFTYEDLLDFQACLALDGGRFDMLFGRDETLLAGLALGARGAVGSTYNFAAPLYTRLLTAFHAGDLAAARREQQRAVAMIRFLLACGMPFMPASKAIMGMLGVECGPTRLPLPAIIGAQREALYAGLQALGFFADACQADEAMRS